MADKPTFLNVLRMWLGLVGIMGFGNTVQCVISEKYLSDRLYTVDSKNVSDLTARLFAVWTLLSAALRFICAFNITNRTIFSLTFFSFVLVLIHFMSEVFIFKTALIQSSGIIAPLVITGISIVSMLIGYYFINEKDSRLQSVNENDEILSGKARKKFR